MVFVRPELRGVEQVVARYSVLLPNGCLSFDALLREVRRRMRDNQDARGVNSEEALDLRFADLRADDNRGSTAEDRIVESVAVLPVTVAGDLGKPGLEAMLQV